MMASTALIVAGFVFGIVALLHVSRLILKFDIIIGKKSIPLWVNMIGLVISVCLSAWMFIAVCC